MARASFCLPVALAYLFIASVVPSNAQNAGEERRVSVAAGAPLAVECRLRPEQRAVWRLDGGTPPTDLRADPEAPAADGRLTVRLRAAAARPQHAGLYTCSADGARGPRVRVAVLPARASAAPPALAASPPTADEEADQPELLYDVRANFTLRCELPNDNSLAYVWTKNDTNVEEIWDLKDRYKLEHGGAEFIIPRSVEDDFGNYTCGLSGTEAVQRWAVRGRAFTKLPANTNVVEGQKLKLQCKVIGKPYPRVLWTYSNASEGENASDVRQALGERVTLRRSAQGVEDGELLLDAALRSDAGLYSCTAPVGPAGAANVATTTLRVKDMYAALWPFLGICAEVFILCAIILVYEKRRTKPDLDDSDTDNHDQKKS